MPENTKSGIDWNAFVESLSKYTAAALTSIFGKSDKYEAQALNTLYKKQEQTNIILWVVIGLMMALGVVLLLRKK